MPEERVLYYARSGATQDALERRLGELGFRHLRCRDEAECQATLPEPHGILLLEAAVVTEGLVARIKERMAHQPVWSDIPIVIWGQEGAAAEMFNGLLPVYGVDETAVERLLAAALQRRRRQLATQGLLVERQSMLEVIQDVFVVLAEDWTYLYVNQTACAVCGLSREEFVGKTFWELFPMALDSPLEEFLRRAMHERKAQGFEWQSRLLPGKWFNTRVYPVPGGLACLSVDITERKNAEQELERVRQEAVAANRAKDHFLAALSHELRTPLSPVLLTVAELQQDPELPQRVREELAMIRRNVEMEARLIDDLLDVTRITKGKLALHKERIHLQELAQRALVTASHPSLLQKRLEILFRSEAPEISLEADPARLQQILWNLLSNAIKFTQAGGRVELIVRKSATGMVAVEVRDNGRGISPEQITKLFAAFEQGDAGVPQQFGGLGMGLTISKALAELHGGTLSAHSEGPGSGACFILELPWSEQAETTPATQLPQTVERPVTGARRVLLVEDHGETREVLARLLRRAGYEVTAAAGKQDAIAAAAQGVSFDFLVSDLGLADGSGLDLMRALREQFTHGGIALSGYGMESDVLASRDAGFAHHLTKPIDWKRLQAALDQLSAAAKPDSSSEE
jgi:PAS domain S-box-containing protein